MKSAPKTRLKRPNVGIPGDAAAAWPVMPQWLPAAILVLTFLVFSPTFAYQFVYDDNPQIVRNRYVQSWEHLPSYFTTHVWRNIQPQGGHSYRPAFFVWLLSNHTIFGLQAAGWHFGVVLLHVVATLGVFLLVRKMSGNAWMACCAMLLFGLQPIHIESVAWVSGATDPLLTVFFIGTFLAYLHSREGRRRAMWWGAALAAFAAALLAKETAIVLPALIFAYELLVAGKGPGEPPSVGRRAWTATRAVAPYAAVTLIYFAARMYALRGGAGEESLAPPNVFFTAPSLLWFYVRQIVLPVGLSAFYDTPFVTSMTPGGFAVPALIVLALLAVLWRFVRQSAQSQFWLTWFWLTLLPTLAGLMIFQDADIAHDRYLYLPSVAFSALVAMLIWKLPHGDARLAGLPRRPVITTLGIAILYAAGSLAQISPWHDNLQLYDRAVKVAPQRSLPRNLLANELFRRGQTQDAIAMYHESLRVDPGSWRTNFSLANTYLTIGKFTEAEIYFSSAIDIDSRNGNQHYFRGLALLELMRFAEAEASLRRAQQLAPDTPELNLALGIALEQQGKTSAALEQYFKELARNPQSSRARERIAKIGSGTSGAGSASTRRP